MAKSRLVLSIDTNLPVGTLQNIASDSSSRAKPFGQKIRNLFNAMLIGARSGSVKSGVVDSGAADAASASLAGTFTGAPTATETIAINGVTITFVASSSPANNEVSVAGSPSASTMASRLAAAINASTSDDLSGVVNASASGAVCTVSCNIAGVLGNKIAVADSASNFSWAGAATALSGGLGKLPVPTTFSFGK